MSFNPNALKSKKPTVFHLFTPTDSPKSHKEELVKKF